VNKILVSDHEKDSRISLTDFLTGEGYDVDTASDHTEAMKMMQANNYELVITELFQQKCDGEINHLAWIRNNFPHLSVIVITTQGSIDCVVKSIKMGAIDYILKPINKETLLAKVREVLNDRRVLQSIRGNKEVYNIHDIVGISESMQRVIETALKVSQLDCNVLIVGESGTGKELVAKAIHHQGQIKPESSFVAINCAAIPDHILESELFGYVKGAFTGALKDKKGLFEEAHNGTLFMDEIGDSTSQFQSKLLRVIEEKKIRRVGDTKNKKVNVRLIAASNKNISAMVQEGTFRADLYYRLGVVDIKIPSLAERKEDIYPLIHHFIHNISKRFGKEVKQISEEAVQVLLAYNWPGNVRELQNTIERAVALSGHTVLLPEDFPFAYDAYRKSVFPDHDEDVLPLKEIEKRYLLKIMKKYSYNQKIVAQKLGIGYTTLWRKLKEIDNET
jgi:DNA-binding NtrC family response regulator